MTVRKTNNQVFRIQFKTRKILFLTEQSNTIEHYGLQYMNFLLKFPFGKKDN